MQDLYRRIYEHPQFHELEKKRSRLSWTLAILVMLCYFSFILIIAFAPEIFALPITVHHVTTWGIPIGILVIVLSFSLTGVYVYLANTQFDEMKNHILEQVRAEHE